MPDRAASLYEQDFYAWANEQAALLRAGKLSAADIDHIAEEIESMGRSEKRELMSRLMVLLTHLLKWRYQPALRTRSWRATIINQRRDVAEHLAENPSLRATLDQSIAAAYERAKTTATAETELDEDTFPTACPWPFERFIDTEFWPDDAARH